MSIIRKLALLLTVLSLMPQLTLAQGGQFTPYAWDEADLALLYPSDFDAPQASTEAETGRLSLQIEHGAANKALLLRVLPGSVADADLRAELDSALAALDLLPVNYTAATLFGARADSASGVSADRALIGEARIGRLPDQRVFAIVGRAPANQQEVLSDTLQTVIDSVVFSADSAPTVPAYTLMWRFPNPAEPASAVTITRLVGLAYAPNNRVYALDAEQGVIVLNAETGALIDSISFDNPAQPRAIAADDAGTVYVADATCQCIRTLDAGGAWRDPIGTFSGGAPYGVAVAADGTVYATDKSPDGYEVHVYREGALTVAPLSFNSVAAPLLTADSSGQGVVLEWLTSLIDSSVSGAVSVISGNSAGLRYWLEPFVPEDVFAIAGDNTGRLLLATAGQGILAADPLGRLVERITVDLPARALAGGPDGVIYLIDSAGAVSAWSNTLAPTQRGERQLRLGVPVQGTLSETLPLHTWTYAATAGEQVTLTAVDLSRNAENDLRLDMGLRLIAPDGSEVAANDDDLSGALYGIYDAQIADVVLAQSGIYTIQVEQVQGTGTYTLGISGSQWFDLHEQGVTRIEGHISDIYPTERWMFRGTAGDSLTFTMLATSGDLDPLLELLDPVGQRMAFNDDTNDPDLGVNAQIAGVLLPEDGVYVLEASRYEGTGRYEIVIVTTR